MQILTLITALPGAVAQGLIWGIMAIGVYITFRILDIADLTVDGTMCTGGAVCIMMMLSGHNVWISMLAATLAGMLAGLATGIFQRRDRRARAELQPHGKGPRGHDLRGRERAQQALHAVFAHDRRRHRLLGLRCADPLQPGGEPDARARAGLHDDVR